MKITKFTFGLGMIFFASNSFAINSQIDCPPISQIKKAKFAQVMFRDPAKPIYVLHSNSFEYNHEQWSVSFEIYLPRKADAPFYPLKEGQHYFDYYAVFSEPSKLFSPRSGFKICNYGGIDYQYMTVAVNTP